MVTRESEWDDNSRARAEALSVFEAETCTGCGLHPTIATDPANVFTFDEHTCPVCKGQDIYGRVVADRDDRATNDKAPPGSPRPSDGRHIYLRQVDPEEVEKIRRDREARRTGTEVGSGDSP